MTSSTMMNPPGATPFSGRMRDGRVAFPAAGMPVATDGVAIDPAELNRNDGFSPNTPILTYVEDLDAEAPRLRSQLLARQAKVASSPIISFHL